MSCGLGLLDAFAIAVALSAVLCLERDLAYVYTCFDVHVWDDGVAQA